MYKFFWGIDDIESNFYPSFFQYKNLSFTCSEQAYMYEKALYFGDAIMASRILQLRNPAEHKKAGKLVKDFDPVIWSKVKTQYMYQVCMAKFYQNPLIRESFINSTEHLVEASPYDLEWGIGLDAYTAVRTKEEDWPGKNLLGKVLMHVRSDLHYKINHDSVLRVMKFDNII